MLPELILIALEENQAVHMFDGVEVWVVQHCQVEAVRMMTQERLTLTFTQVTEISEISQFSSHQSCQQLRATVSRQSEELDPGNSNPPRYILRWPWSLETRETEKLIISISHHHDLCIEFDRIHVCFLKTISIVPCSFCWRPNYHWLRSPHWLLLCSLYD